MRAHHNDRSRVPLAKSFNDEIRRGRILHVVYLALHGILQCQELPLDVRGCRGQLLGASQVPRTNYFCEDVNMLPQTLDKLCVEL